MYSLFQNTAFQTGPTFSSQKKPAQEDQNFTCISEANIKARANQIALVPWTLSSIALYSIHINYALGCYPRFNKTYSRSLMPVMACGIRIATSAGSGPAFGCYPKCVAWSSALPPQFGTRYFLVFSSCAFLQVSSEGMCEWYCPALSSWRS